MEKFNHYWARFYRTMPYLAFVAFALLCWRWFEFTTQQQHDWAEPIINGIISGIVVAVLVLLFTVVWKSNITPWIENLLYKDAKIEGVWNGILVSYIGIDELDKDYLKVGFGVLERRRKRRRSKPEPDTATDSRALAAQVVDENGSKDVEAELIIKKMPEEAEDQGEVVDRKLVIKISAPHYPIEVRAELKRVGHHIYGQIVEIGGASQIHTYRVSGSFKNLILSAEYENEDCSHIDRGSLSLMLRNNGMTLEGFFSSYADGEHSMVPFKCVLKRQRSDRNEA